MSVWVIFAAPTAEGSFRSIVSKQELSECFEIDSAGTHAYHVGNPQIVGHNKLQESIILTYPTKELGKFMKVIFITMII